MAIQITKKIVGFNTQVKQEPAKSEAIQKDALTSEISKLAKNPPIINDELAEIPASLDMANENTSFPDLTFSEIPPTNILSEAEFINTAFTGFSDLQESEIQESIQEIFENKPDENLTAVHEKLVEFGQAHSEVPDIINTSPQSFSKEKVASNHSIDTFELGSSEEIIEKLQPLFEETKVRESFTAESIANVNVIDYEENKQAFNETTYSILNKSEDVKQKQAESFTTTMPANTTMSNEQTNKAMQNSKKTVDNNQMHELIERPEMLVGSTYKVKTPLSEHAMYITINDMILNEGTGQETRQPFEVFINSKSMDHFQWIVALTRIISAVFRKGGDITFLVGELRSVFDPKGGYFKSGGQYMPSLVAEIGDVIERHLKMIGMIDTPKKDPAIAKLIDEKRVQIEAKKIDTQQVQASDFPKGAILCSKCLVNAVILMDGCMTCLNCGDSKCG